jgi:ribokinase
VRVAVVGHVEWVDFLLVERVPAAGEIVQARASWQEAAGGGADAVVQLRKLAGAATIFTALGDDALGKAAKAEIEGRGVRVEAAWRGDPQRRAVCFLDAHGERTIALLGPKLVPHADDPLPWDELARTDGVYFTGGDAEALRLARRARVLVASARELPTLQEAGVELDILVASARDAGEPYRAGDLDPPPRRVVRTEGAAGGTVEPGGRFPAAPRTGPLVDTYGAGDAFAAGLTYGLASGLDVTAALALASRCGAAVVSARGAYDGQLTH